MSPRPHSHARAFIPAPPGARSAPSSRAALAPPASRAASALSVASAAPAARAPPHAASAPAALPAAARSLLSVPLFPSPAAPAASARRVVVWFRADLRLHDHPALTHALEECAAGGAVLPVFCFDPRAFGKTAFGFEKTGRYRAKFLVESVHALRESLRALGSDLVVRLGRPEDVLPDLCRRVGAKVLMCHKEVSFEEKKLERVLEAELEKTQVEFHPLWANTLYHVDDLPFPVDHMPDVYTKFREAVQKSSVIRDPLPLPKEMPRMPKVDPGKIPTLPELGLTEPMPDAHGMHKFAGGEDEALKRLRLYVEESDRIPEGRSTATHLGADFSCRISPWLALGCVSPRRIYADLAKKAGKAGQTTTYFELIWRDFFRYITAKYNRAKVLRSSQDAATYTKSPGVTGNIPAMATP